MTQPENFTAAQAADPTTPGQVLADIAALRPDLRVAVAGNPSAYPGLIEWLQSLGEPTVDAAIAARGAAAAQPTQVLPVQPPVAPGVQTPPAPQWAQQPGYSGAPAASLPPQGQPPYGQPPYGQPPQGTAPQGGLQYGAPAPKSSNKTLWIVLGIVGGLLVLGGIGTFLAVKVFADKAGDAVDDVIDTITDAPLDPDAGSYGDDPALDALWDSCEAGDYQACDDLYVNAPVGSDYEAFGDTCGNRTEGNQLCVVELGDGGSTDTTPNAYGDDADLDALWDACEAEDWQACDDLYMESAIGSEYETYGHTCGNRTEGSSTCVGELGDGTGTITEGANTFGDDPTLDALWTACEGGDGQSCDDLYWSSPLGSEYESFGHTCAGRVPEGAATCVG